MSGNGHNGRLAEITSIEGPDEAFRVWCPVCGFVLAEGMGIGSIVRFACKNCKADSTIVRASRSLITSAYIHRMGIPETLWRTTYQLVQQEPFIGRKPVHATSRSD